MHDDARYRILCGGEDGCIYEVLPDSLSVHSLAAVANVGYPIRGLHRASGRFLVMATGNFDFLCFWDGDDVRIYTDYVSLFA